MITMITNAGIGTIEEFNHRIYLHHNYLGLLEFKILRKDFCFSKVPYSFMPHKIIG